MESMLEAQRRAHEELERIEAAAVAELAHKAKGHREKLAQEHRVLQLLNRYKERSEQLLAIYEDAKGTRKQEIEALSGPNEFSEFYRRLKAIKDFHRQFPNEVVDPMDAEFHALTQDRDATLERLEATFTGEEAFGRFLDLNNVYNTYLTLKGITPISYMAYLDDFDRFVRIPPDTKATPAYKTYLESLHRYLVDFVVRAQPLQDLDAVVAPKVAAFESQWQAGTVRGWEPEANDEKDEQQRRLFCVACGKEFAKQTVFDAHLPGKKHKAAEQLLAQKGGQLDEATIAAEHAKQREKRRAAEKVLAELEVRIAAIGQTLVLVRENTKANVERKQTRTVDEREEDMELEAENLSSSESEDDDDKPVYNANVRLGWDGKPIPYWLYRLHGLSKSYDCQICDEKYHGRKVFERHFTEWKHASMLRKMGIPNTTHFQDVTTFDDALALWEKIKKDKHVLDFKNEQEEEFEDSNGNVMSRKTYEDMRRQGLL